MKKALITGGEGDLAKRIKEDLESRFLFYAPGKKEFDVTILNNVKTYIKMNGPFDLVINNAGTIHPKRILDSEEAQWVRDILVNLVGPYYVSKNCLEQNPNVIIINIASTAAFAAYRDWSSYCSSKAGLITLTKSLANDNFKVYAIAPGAILTKFRNYLSLPNDNALSTGDISAVLCEILDEKYNPGDIVFMRKNEKKVL